VLSVRQWESQPYKSPQEILIEIPAEVVGVQKLTIEYEKGSCVAKVDGKKVYLNDLAKNDGLGFYDFKDWFKPVFEKACKEPVELAIIHFTKFRYEPK
jgi:hypothetical protein